jgi:phage/plasmid-associated DNA primase
MNRQALAPKEWPIFPRLFHVFQDEQGRQAVLEEYEPGIVGYRDESVVTAAIAQYCWGELGGMLGADLSHKAAVACGKLWLSLTPALEVKPLALAEKSTPGLAFRRLPFDAPPEFDDEGCSRFQEFLSRCSQPSAVAAFLGSLFYPNADRQQYLYFYGEGQDGKGSLLRMLYRLLGSACQSLQPKKGDDRFWNMKTYGKRLVMFPDCDDFRFFASPEFKSLTGNDPIFFEEKGRSGFTDIPMCKLIAASNHRPNVSSQKSDMRRLIYVEVAPVTEMELVPNYEDLLYAEAEAIVRTCKATFERLAPDHGTIPCELAIEVAMEAEDDALSIFDRYFVHTGDEKHAISGAQVREVLNKENVKNGVHQRQIKEAWRRHFDLRIKHTRRGTLYYGVKKRPFAGDWDEVTGDE